MQTEKKNFVKKAGTRYSQKFLFNSEKLNLSKSTFKFQR